jgi:beta-glucosidase
MATRPSTGPLGRHARGGRNWESFGPDPYLAGIAMNASVRGIQSVGVQACSKHFIGNEQETQRTSTTTGNGTVFEAVSANIDDRTLHELYLWPFADAVKAGTSSIMCSYNRVNGKYSCGNSEMLSILTDELGFPGYVVSDWYASHGTADFANAGLDIEMPGNVSAAAGASYFGATLLQAVNNSTVSRDRLAEMAERVLTPYFLLGQDEGYLSVDPASGASFLVYQYGHDAGLPYNYPMVDARNVRDSHSKAIRRLGAAATVMLKNVNNTLPLRRQKEIGIFGSGAPDPTIGSVFLDYGEHPEGFKTGAFDIGGGSGTVRHTKFVAPLEAVRTHVETLGGRVQVLTDNEELVKGQFRTIYPVPDVCLLFLKTYATEGQDRPSLEIGWNGTAAVEAIARLCPNTVVILHGPGIVLMPWADNENVTAILTAHFPGEEMGNSIVDVLWGMEEPSGRLPYTIPRMESDYGPPITNLTSPVADPDAWQADFDEGQMIDYRHFDAEDIEPLYEFGFGLSYTKFEIGVHVDVDIASGLSPIADESKGTAPGGLRDLWSPVATVTMKVTNTGSSPGSAIPQLYLGFPQATSPAGTPVRVLRGFEKVHLEAAETKEVKLTLLRRDASFWEEVSRSWVIPSGDFDFSVGLSSRDLRATARAAVLY